jgi:hypothetical protein
MAVMVGLTLVVVGLTPVTLPDLIPSMYIRWYLHIPGASAPDPAPSFALAAALAPDNLPNTLNSFLSDFIHQDLRRALLLTGGGEFEPRLAAALGLPWLVSVPGWIVVGLVALGAVRWAALTPGGRRHNLSLFEFSALVYLLVILLWRDRDDRLLYPVLPALYVMLLLGVWAALQAAGRGLARLTPDPARKTQLTQRLPLALVMLFAAGWVALACVRDWQLQSSYEAWGDLHRRTSVIEQYVPRDAVLGTDWSTLDSLYLQRDVLRLNYRTGSADELLARWRSQNIQYVALALEPDLNTFGITPDYDQMQQSLGLIRELAARGSLVAVHADPLPLQIFRLEP